MTTFNGSEYLKAQLDSILHQTLPPDELVVCDDRSSDRTVEILENFAKSAPFAVRIIQNPVNLGYIKNFGNAISACTGDLVFLCDQDDVWRKDKIELFVGRAFDLTEKPALLFSDAILIDNQGKQIGISLRKSLKIPQIHVDPEELLSRNIVTGATCAINRPLINRLDIAAMPKSVPHDYSLALLAWVIGNVVSLDEALISYRIHENNQIGVRFGIIKKLTKALRPSDTRYCAIEEIRCREIAKFLEKYDTGIAKYFWRKSSFFRLLNTQPLYRDAQIILKHYTTIFRGWSPLPHILRSIFRETVFPTSKENSSCKRK